MTYINYTLGKRQIDVGIFTIDLKRKNWSLVIMAYNSIEELSQEIKEQMPQHAQQIFVAAFNAAQEDGMSEEGAREVAWNSVKNQFRQESDGKWHIKGDELHQHHKAVTSGGN
jgi:cation transport regulator